MPPQDIAHESRTPEPSEPLRIHILGLGNIGKLFAHSLAGLEPRPPITLLLHRPELVPAFRENASAIDIITSGQSSKISGFDIELLGGPCDQHITNLIVATKATQTLAAIRSVRSRLSEKSNIVFAQNGKGTIEEVTENLFPDPETRPAFLPTVILHGLTATGPFSSIHAGVGYVTIAAPKNRPQVRYLLECIVRAPALHASEGAEEELLAVQLEKLVVNAVLNPLTALFRVLNGEVVNTASIMTLWHAVVRECSEVLRAWLKLQGVEGIEERFGFETLALMVKEKAELTGRNRSSMLQDVEAGRETEINYINGWIVVKGKELGVNVKVNEKVIKFLEEGRKFDVDEAAVRKEFGEL